MTIELVSDDNHIVTVTHTYENAYIQGHILGQECAHIWMSVAITCMEFQNNVHVDKNAHWHLTVWATERLGW